MQELQLALKSGLNGFKAMTIQVFSLMWLRTIMNYQYKNGGSFKEVLFKLYKEGGIPRFYSGIIPALIQGPLCRFGDTFSNSIILNYLEQSPIPIFVKTLIASGTSGIIRILLSPVDTIKTMQQVEGKNALKLLGKKIRGYRAPAFSIGENNKWAFEIFHKYGIDYDASIFPAARDFGGFPSFGHNRPVMLSYQGIEIKEFPICMTRLLGKDIAYSGGGYFRLFPLWYVLKTINNSDYVMTYFHIGDLLPGSNKVMSREDYETYFKENGSIFNRYKRFVKSNLGRNNAFEKMSELITHTKMINIDQAIHEIQWEKTDKVFL